MKILIDMNLSPTWVSALAEAGFEALHWSTVGNAAAKDEEIFDFARNNGYIIFTHDLDFGTILALTQAVSPSVIQIRSQAILPSDTSETVISVILNNRDFLFRGALIVIDETRARIRVLPLRR